MFNFAANNTVRLFSKWKIYVNIAGNNTNSKTRSFFRNVLQRNKQQNKRSNLS